MSGPREGWSCSLQVVTACTLAGFFAQKQGGFWTSQESLTQGGLDTDVIMGRVTSLYGPHCTWLTTANNGQAYCTWLWLTKQAHTAPACAASSSSR